jgi:hypothetical protein
MWNMLIIIGYVRDLRQIYLVLAYIKRIDCKLELSKSCGNVNWVCLAHDRNSEYGMHFSYYFLQKKSSLFWSFFCISDFISFSAVNMYTAAIISFYAI